MIFFVLGAALYESFRRFPCWKTCLFYSTRPSAAIAKFQWAAAISGVSLPLSACRYHGRKP